MTQADLTHERLVRAALELFTTQGYHPTTTDALARKAGVAEGTIYRHFTGKQHLLNELYRAATRWGIARVREADTAGPGIRAKLALLADLLVTGVTQEPALVRLLLLQDHGALYDQESRDAAREFKSALETVVALGKAEGAVRPGGVDVLAAAWLGVIRVALERVLSREWGPTSAGVKLCANTAWDAIKAGGDGA